MKASGSFDHTTDPNERVKYNSNPPTSGRHYVVPADDGAYTTAPDRRAARAQPRARPRDHLVPAEPAQGDARADLKALFDEDTYQMVLVPRTKMPYQAGLERVERDPAPAGKGRLLLCDAVDSGGLGRAPRVPRREPLERRPSRRSLRAADRGGRRLAAGATCTTSPSPQPGA